MKHLLIILSFLLISSPVIGQSKPLGVVLPPTVMGNVSNSRKQILLNTLDDEVSKYFDVSPPTNVSSGELPVVSDVFQLQIVEEDGDTQLSLRWMSGNERRVETKLCGGCKTIELNGKLKELVGKLFGGKKVEPVLVDRPLVKVKKRPEEVVDNIEWDGPTYQGILYYRKENGKWGWFKGGGGTRYIGEIGNDLPNGKGIIYYSNGNWYEGEYRNGKEWNGIVYHENGEVLHKYVNGK